MTDSLPAKCDNCSNTSYMLNVTWLPDESYKLLCDECQQEEKTEEDRG